jgi:hypothetical protein
MLLANYVSLATSARTESKDLKTTGKNLDSDGPNIFN